MKRLDISAPVLSQQDLGHGILLLAILAPEIAKAALPGQFCMLHAGSPETTDPLLRRPFSIHYADGDTIFFLYRVVGKGTRLIAAMRPGDVIRILGPLGCGFSISAETKNILVGGGLGTAPLFFLARSLPREGTTIMLGAKTSGELARADAFLPHAEKVFLSTDDGSLGQHGLVTELLAGHIQRTLCTGFLPLVSACGPWPMVRAVAHLCHINGIPCQVSLEARMACGTGLCLGCAIPRSGGGYLHVCTDGPVLDAALVDWETSQ